MKNTVQENQALAAAQTTARVDIYTSIHKALRALMADTLVAVGRVDPGDTEDLTTTGERVMQLLDFCVAHLGHETTFVHTAIEARAPGASALIGHEHDEHLQHINSLKGAVATLWSVAATPDAAPAALDLYRKLALFVADNLQHMHTEETAHNAVLWARYTDAELLALHDALVASIPPADMMFTLRWMAPALNPAERTALLSDMQAHAPAPAFAAALQLVQAHLSAPEWAKLARSLGLPPAPGLVAA